MHTCTCIHLLLFLYTVNPELINDHVFHEQPRFTNYMCENSRYGDLFV